MSGPGEISDQAKPPGEGAADDNPALGPPEVAPEVATDPEAASGANSAAQPAPPSPADAGASSKPAGGAAPEAGPPSGPLDAPAAPKPRQAKARIENEGSAPPLPGVDVRLPPTVAAGVDLAKLVLKILTWAIVIFACGLALVELHDSSHEASVSDEILRQAAVETDQIDPAEIEHALDLIANALAAPEAKASDRALDEMGQLRASLVRYRIISEDQRRALEGCFPFPTGDDRAAKLKACADQLRLAGKAAKVADLEKLRTLIGFSKDIDAQRQSFRSFWIQAAQLVLLNLLLPLLSGLFGYIFGTRQGANGRDA